jgi:hypothetical protein
VSLQDWLKDGWLTEHKPSRQEIRDLLGVADRDLADCSTPGLSADWRLNIAYNAGLQLATAVLAAAGYRATRNSHHYRVIQSPPIWLAPIERSLLNSSSSVRSETLAATNGQAWCLIKRPTR